MKKYYFILIRILRVNYKSLKSLTNFSVIISTLLCVVFTSITLSISDGFKQNIISKIIFFDGYARFNHIDLSISDLESINNHFKSDVKPYYESQYIIKSNQDSELINLFSSNNILEKISNVYGLDNNSQKNGVYIGVGLKDKLFSSDNNLSAVLINMNNDPFNIVNIIGYFETGVPLFDEHMVISNIRSLNFYSGIPNGYIVNKESFEKINTSLSVRIYTYEDRYYDFLKWLDSYDLPIYILLLFILAVGLINNKFCYTIDILNRKVDSSIFYNSGLSKIEISYLYWYKFLVLNIIGVILGVTASLLILYLELQFNFIQIPSEVYFTSVVPIIFKFQNFIYAPLIMLLQVFYFAIFRKENI